MRSKRLLLAPVCAGLALLGVAGPAAATDSGVFTKVKPYVKPVGKDYKVKPLLSVGDRVPRAGGGGKYQMVGIPDGLGLRPRKEGGSLLMNHELANTVVSEPFVGGPLNRGAFVSSYRLADDGSVTKGDRAYDTVYRENDYAGLAPDSTNDTPGFGRFCSGLLAGPEVGFDRYMYLTGEESGGASTFDGKGGQAVAVYGNQLHTLPKMGRFAKENSVVMPKTGNRTVVFPTEDGPSTPDSQLWMYVGEKEKKGTPLAKNGLDNGKLYVYALDTPRTEIDFQSGTVLGEWVEIPNAEDKSEAELEAAADAVGAFGLIRPEDGAASKTNRGDFYFVTTGGGAGPGNRLGRLYRLHIDVDDPTAPASLKVIYNADTIVANGGDTALSPDNIDVSKRYLMINEDGTDNSRPVMGQKGRDGSIWRFDLRKGFARKRVAQLNPPGRDGVPVGPGVWETSGIIDTTAVFGKDTWLTDAQAHAPTTAPRPNTVEDGQLVLMKPRKGKSKKK